MGKFKHKLGDIDDSFYLAEEYLEKMGKEIDLPKKKNLLLRTTHELESKSHATHSELQRLRRLMDRFKTKAMLNTKLKNLKKRLI